MIAWVGTIVHGITDGETVEAFAQLRGRRFGHSGQNRPGRGMPGRDACRAPPGGEPYALPD
ncbi:MAG: hypothetical protein ACLQIK_15430 [Mycobacterium sp.]|uniref:hypothetical protein n=1 Tax=Mycobacterium sp. TaxID=1785 RepID=UPI003F96366C